ncbi:hypothetical protein [Novosphingopyxis sp.]|uniref:hypothetical protein n=1 Tax=Novosphingopyxis sp. TaxID=2709690 RepID=UPI003B5C3413
MDINYHIVEDGIEMATLLRADLEKLIEAAEDAGDLAAAYQARKEIDEAGAVPMGVSMAIRGGKHPIVAWRHYLHWTQAKLAEEAAAFMPGRRLTQAAIGRLETADPGAGRSETLAAIAQAMGAPRWSIEYPDTTLPDELQRDIENGGDPETGMILRAGGANASSAATKSAKSGKFITHRSAVSGRLLGGSRRFGKPKKKA